MVTKNKSKDTSAESTAKTTKPKTSEKEVEGTVVTVKTKTTQCTFRVVNN